MKQFITTPFGIVAQDAESLYAQRIKGQTFIIVQIVDRRLIGRKVTGMIREYIIKVDDTKTDIMGSTPLEEPPTELIRCKDCRKRREWFCELDGKYHSPNFFCGFGKRKDS